VLPETSLGVRRPSDSGHQIMSSWWSSCCHVLLPYYQNRFNCLYTLSEMDFNCVPLSDVRCVSLLVGRLSLGTRTFNNIILKQYNMQAASKVMCCSVMKKGNRLHLETSTAVLKSYCNHINLSQALWNVIYKYLQLDGINCDFKYNVSHIVHLPLYFVIVFLMTDMTKPCRIHVTVFFAAMFHDKSWQPLY
jgi:hypothetical protein